MSKALDGAKKKGREARLNGSRRDECPYRDIRTYRGSVTFSRGFVRAWLDGWDEADREGDSGRPTSPPSCAKR